MRCTTDACTTRRGPGRRCGSRWICSWPTRNWTAEQIEAEIGHRPTVLLGGVNRDNFRPWGGPKRHSVLCSGIDKWWKGTDTIREAGRLLGLPVEGYAGLGLDQMALGREYDAALVFAVGSWFEGFCQPGLEALACGVPLVTTDNGGCREYALDEQTALVVPPRDAPAMAAAIERLLEDDTLAKQLAANGLDLVEEHFDWEARTDQFAEILDGVVAGAASPPPAPPAAPVEPTLSVVVLTWDNLLLTQRFVETVRQRTDVDYELIIVDNGSAVGGRQLRGAGRRHRGAQRDQPGVRQGNEPGPAGRTRPPGSRSATTTPRSPNSGRPSCWRPPRLTPPPASSCPPSPPPTTP
jgi:hypothetical protein